MRRQSNPLVSVVVPMYNVSEYIKACIDSILEQTFQNFELICVNDGCTDDTVDKVMQYSDKRVCIIHKENGGLSSARNAGIFAARGLYIALLDSDDIWHKQKLSYHVRHLATNATLEVSYSPSLFIDAKGNDMGIGQFPKLQNITLRDIMCRNPIGNGSAPVIKRSTLLKHVRINPCLNKEEIFNESLRQSEDIELWLRIALTSPLGFEGIPQPLTYYRVNAEGLSANTEKQFKAWHTAIWTIAAQHSSAKNLFSLAKAYQLRYLARRAVQSGDRWTALRLVHKALVVNPKIAIQEPARTLSTYICSVLRLLPSRWYEQLESVARGYMAKLNQSCT